MPRPEFSQPGTRGGGQKIATNDRPEIKTVDASTTGSIASGNVETVEVTAPAGSIYRVRMVRLYCGPDGNATSGSHRFKVYYTAPFDLNALYGKSAYNSELNFDSGYWKTADQVARPPDQAGPQNIVETLRATPNTSLARLYRNNLDVSMDNERSTMFLVEESSL